MTPPQTPQRQTPPHAAPPCPMAACLKSARRPVSVRPPAGRSPMTSCTALRASLRPSPSSTILYITPRMTLLMRVTTAEATFRMWLLKDLRSSRALRGPSQAPTSSQPHQHLHLSNMAAQHPQHLNLGQLNHRCHPRLLTRKCRSAKREISSNLFLLIKGWKPSKQ